MATALVAPTTVARLKNDRRDMPDGFSSAALPASISLSLLRFTVESPG
jgi:hypothetical protein